jgi:hypothetical protein
MLRSLICFVLIVSLASVFVVTCSCGVLGHVFTDTSTMFSLMPLL